MFLGEGNGTHYYQICDQKTDMNNHCFTIQVVQSPEHIL